MTADDTNQLTENLCANIKEHGIRLFTVAFAVTDPGIKEILETCAAARHSHFDAEDNAALISAFMNISKAFMRLKLSN